jgi:tetratricopeptide (TPR) repeat protein
MCRTLAVSRDLLLKQWGRFRHWLGAQMARGHSWLAAQQLTRKALDRTFLVGLLAVVALIIWFKPDVFAARAWAMSILVVVILLLAAATYYRLARSIYPKEFPQRIRIRPFTSLREKSTYSGHALARLLEQAMRAPDKSKEAPPSQVGLEPKAPSFNVSVAGATISLDFIWGIVERWILGPAYTVEGIVSNSGRTIVLEAWSYERAVQWRAVSSAEPESDPLRTAIADLAEKMKVAFGHYRELRDTYTTQRRYGNAIFVAEQLNKAEQGTGITLAHLYLSAGQLDQAETALKDAREKSKDVQVLSGALLGLAFVRSAKGRHSEAIARLKKVRQGREAQTAKSFVARVLYYRKKFRSAQKILESLATDIEGSLERLLKTEVLALSVGALRLKRDDLDEEEQNRLYVDLTDLALSYGTLGRCAEELGDRELAKRSYGLAAEVSMRRAHLWVPYHAVASDLGIWLKDLARCDPGRYDEAIDANDWQFRDAYDYYRENPLDAGALTNMAWAVAGKVACLAAKVAIKKGELDDVEVPQQVIEHAEEAAGLLQFVPEEQWQAVTLEAEKHSKAGGEREVKSRHAIKPLSKEQTGEFAQLVANLLRVKDPVSATALIIAIARRKQSDEKAQRYFKKLAQTGDDANTAEAFFGLACVHATCERYDEALDHLKQAIGYIEDIKNRAWIAADLKVLREDERYREKFAKLVKWDRTPVSNAQ